MSRRSLILTAVSIGVVLLIAANTLMAFASTPITYHVSAPAGPLQTAAAMITNIPLTLAALGTKGFGGLGGAQTGVPSTQTAIASMVDVYRTQYAQTLTAIAPTVEALKSNLPGTATALAGTVVAAETGAPRSVLTGDAGVVLAAYSQFTLGTSVKVLASTGQNFNILGKIPIKTEITNAQVVADALAGTKYSGVLSNGLAWLAVGDGTATANSDPMLTSQNASLGIFVVRVSGSAADANSALTLAQSTFPNLAKDTFTPFTAQGGYGFIAQTTITTLDPQTNALTLVPQTVILHFIAGPNIMIVVVGNGLYSTLLHPQTPN